MDQKIAKKLVMCWLWHFYYKTIDYKCLKVFIFRNSFQSSVVICICSLIGSPRRTRVAIAGTRERSHVFCARIFDGNGSAVNAFKVPRHGYLSSFYRVHALIGGIINHIAVARFAHPLRSCRYALLLHAPPWTRARARADARWINCVSRRHGYTIIISRCWPAGWLAHGPREIFWQLYE